MTAISRFAKSDRWSLLLVTLLGLPLATPLWRWASEPCTHDGHLHYHRIAAMRYAWESGLHFSRWLPDVAFGYGYPFFVFREAVPLYLSLFPHLLGLPLPASINIFYISAILASGWFMYLWVRDLFGPVAGIVSAVAYMAAPYVLVDALVRGNQPESLALALLPLLGWASRRFMISGTTGTFLLAVLSLAFLTLSHNISSLIFVPFLGVYMIAVAWMNRLPWKGSVLRLGLLMGLGLGLSAFYILPALLELDEITISQSVSNRNNDFHFNFASLGEVLAPVSPADPNLLNPPLLLRLGWVPILLAVLGVLSFYWLRGRERRGHVILMTLALLAFLFMALPVSVGLWETLPLVKFVQFPWRFVGRAALPVAFLAGVPFAVLQQRVTGEQRRRLIVSVAPVVAVTLVLLEALPNLYPHICREETQPTINTVHAYEHGTGLVGVDPAGSYFPKTVQARPTGSPLEMDYQLGRRPQRFDVTVLPEGAAIDAETYRPTSASITISSPQPFVARYLSFDFPGWRATVDGQTVPITPSQPDGLITFEVPAGSHVVEVQWQMTPLRRAAMAVTLVALAGLVIASLLLSGKIFRRPAFLSVQAEGATYGDARPASHDNRIFLLLLAVGLGLLAFKLLVVDRGETLFRRPAPPPVNTTTAIRAGELLLEGFNVSQTDVPAGGSFDVDLAWRVIDPPEAEYQSNVWLIGPDGLPWSVKETARPRTFEETSETLFWLPGQWAWDSREVQVFPGTPPGSYRLVVTLFDLATLQPLTLMADDGTVLGPTAVVGQVDVTRPDKAPDFEPQYAQQAAIGGLTLLGYNQDRRQAIPGESVLMTFFWEKPGRMGPAADQLLLELTAEDGRVVQSWELPPVRADYPPDLWQAGERLRGQHALRLAAGLESGVYRFKLDGVSLKELEVQAPERQFVAPPMSRSVGADFDGQIRLAGYNLEPVAPGPGLPLEVELIWQGLAEMPTSYRVFVHLVDEEGQIITQSDGVPAGWTRPTTSWAPGEYVVDRHTLAWPDDLPVKAAQLRVGLYDPANGLRLPVGEMDALMLPIPDGS